MMREKILAWCVHFYTALGLVAAAVMAVLIVRGDPHYFRWVIALMIVATIIDSTDGRLARRWRVKEILPGFDGRRLDDIVDFQTYTSLPLFFIWRAGILPDHLGWWLLVPLLASAYGFCQTEAKTKDHFFLGFPSYWNVIAIYLYWINPPAWISLAFILLFAALTFVPSLYLYTSYKGPFSRLTNILCYIWAAILFLIVFEVFPNSKPLIWISSAFPLYYFFISWAITLHRWLGKPAIGLATDGLDGQSARPEHRLSAIKVEE
jgi:phosphatidylcholine synthase